MIKFYNILILKILNEIIPATKISISKGNKIFGAAILNKNDLSTIIIGTNNEIINPLYHGEIISINNFFGNKVNLNPRDYLFISSHEPVSLDAPVRIRNANKSKSFACKRRILPEISVTLFSSRELKTVALFNFSKNTSSSESGNRASSVPGFIFRLSLCYP